MAVLALILAACLPVSAIADGTSAGARTPDDDNGIDNATLITTGPTYSGSVDALDDQLDYYKMDNIAAGQIIKPNVTYSNASAELNVSVLDPFGRVIVSVTWGSTTRGSTGLAHVNGTYYIEVKAHSGLSDYTLNVLVAYPTAIRSGVPISGNLSTSGANRADYYRIWLEGNQSGSAQTAAVTIAQDNPNVQLGAALMDLLNWNGTHTYNESWNTSVRGVAAAASYTGWYYLWVYISWGTTGYTANFVLGSAAMEADNDMANATLMPRNADLNASVNKAWDHFDWYTYWVPGNDNLNILVHRYTGSDYFLVHAYASNLTFLGRASNPIPPNNAPDASLDLLATYKDQYIYVAVEMRSAYRAIPLYQWTDDEAAMSYNIKFNSRNHPPIIEGQIDNLTMNEDEHRWLDPGTHFSDPDGDTIYYSLSSANGSLTGKWHGANGTLEVIPTANWFGWDTAHITASDPYGGVTLAPPIFVTVLSVDDPPYVWRRIPNITMPQGGTDEPVDLSIVFHDNDTLTGDTLHYSVNGNGSIWVDIQSNGKVRLTDPLSFYGQVTMVFTALDNNSDKAECPCNVTVTHVNQPPEVEKAPPDLEVKEDESVSVDLSPVFWDPEGDPITIVPSGNIQINVSVGGTNLTFSPLPDVSGFTESIKLTAQDDSGLGDAFVTIKVAVMAVNDAPRITAYDPAGAVTLSEDQSQQFSVSAYDPESGPLVTYIWQLDGAQVLMGPSDYLLRTNFSSAGDHTVSVTVSDGELLTVKLWSVQVLNVNRGPVDLKILSPKPGESFRAEDLVVMEGAATDPDGDLLSYTWYEGAKELGEGRTLSLQLAPGAHSVLLEVSDDEAVVRTKSISFSVKANSAPQLQSLAPSSGQRFTQGQKIAFKAEFTDADNDVLSYCWTERGKVLSNSAAFSSSNLSVGKHVLTLTVTDGRTIAQANLTIEIIAKAKGFLPGMGAGLLGLAGLGAAMAMRRGRPPDGML